ncbi:gfo/Idh/MocA family oxidoreductase [Rhodobacteraceae bacterium 2CG4]|uniref:Gfo/Idh/MocA family oxidoreductase n=1 Tax=Halovulum marinum TaxID=2662447 RepID=A0A6L5Z2M3_9RHOB|nr:Gfo/Idh/MocA family oxidoreductase [Halovulum marinum]MSU90529.1 gfo/Idh/MocA family oxidoreductase [Halovulum marinum]
MTDRRVAVVGGGYFARYQIAAWTRIAGVALTCVADGAAGARARVRAEFAGLPVVEDAEAALDLGPLDILDIATPPAAHAGLIRRALGRVPCVICQKPFCNSVEEARDITAEAEAAGTRLVVHENFRFQPWYREAARLLASGRLGAVAQARFALRPGDGAGADAYLDRQPYFRAMPRFLIHETGIHLIDVFRFLFGAPAGVYADLRRVNPVIVGEDAALVILDLAGGGRALFDGNRTLDHAAHDPRLTMGELEIEGAAASLRLTGDGRLWLRERGAAAWAEHPHVFVDRDFGGDCVQAFQQHVVDALDGRGGIETLARDYLANLEVERLVYQSAAEGRKIEIGPPGGDGR